MSDKYISVEKQLARLARLDISCGEVIKKFLETANSEDLMEVKHGKWIDRKFEDDEWYHTCSVCGMVLREDAFDNFCGNCGARMDEV